MEVNPNEARDALNTYKKVNQGPNKGRLQGLELRLSRLLANSVTVLAVAAVSIQGCSPIIPNTTSVPQPQNQEKQKSQETKQTYRIEKADTKKNITTVIEAWSNDKIQKHVINQIILLANNENNSQEVTLISEIFQELKENPKILDWLDHVGKRIIIAPGEMSRRIYPDGAIRQSLAYNTQSGEDLFIFVNTQNGQTAEYITRVLVDEGGDNILEKLKIEAGITDNFLHQESGLEQPYNAALSYFVLDHGFDEQVDTAQLNKLLYENAFKNYGKVPIPPEHRASFERVMKKYLELHPLTSGKKITFTINTDGYGLFGKDTK